MLFRSFKEFSQNQPLFPPGQHHEYLLIEIGFPTYLKRICEILLTCPPISSYNAYSSFPTTITDAMLARGIKGPDKRMPPTKRERMQPEEKLKTKKSSCIQPLRKIIGSIRCENKVIHSSKDQSSHSRSSDTFMNAASSITGHFSTLFSGLFSRSTSHSVSPKASSNQSLKAAALNRSASAASAR